MAGSAKSANGVCVCKGGTTAAGFLRTVCGVKQSGPTRIGTRYM